MDKAIIIGAGLSGLSCAYQLSKVGIDTLILEKSNFIGGLATTFRYRGYQIDIGPHFLLFADENDPMKLLLEEIGLSDDLYQPRVNAGIYCGDALLDPNSPLSSLWSLARSTSMSVGDKIKLLKFILHFLIMLPELEKYSIIEGEYPKHLENVTVKEWVKNHGSENIYDKLVKPLIFAVYGSDEDVPASWLASRLTKAKPRILGSSPFYSKTYYITDSIGKIADKLKEKIENNGGEIRLNNEVKKIHIKNNNVDRITVQNNNSKEIIKTNYIVSTVPAPILTKIAPQLPNHYADLLNNIKYSTLIFTVFGINDVLSKYYSLYISSDDIPFQRYTEPTHLYDKSAPFGKSLICCEVYPKGSFANLWDMSNEDIKKICIKGIEKIFPNVIESIEWTRIWRIKPARVLPGKAKDEIINQGVKTPVNGLYIVNGEIFSSIFEAAYSILMSVSVDKGKEVAKKILLDMNI